MHHIVPRCFRHFFPEKVKSHDFHDVVPLCVDCHCIYEVFANKLKEQICQEFNIILFKRSRIYGYIKALEQHREMIPKDRIEYLENIIKEGDLDFSEETFGERIVKKLDSLQEFVVRWRTHFLLTMEPRFMPSGWDLNNKIRV